jgi:hypothetical protein
VDVDVVVVVDVDGRGGWGGGPPTQPPNYVLCSPDRTSEPEFEDIGGVNAYPSRSERSRDATEELYVRSSDRSPSEVAVTVAVVHGRRPFELAARRSRRDMQL